MKSVFTIIKNPRYFAALFVFASMNILTGTWVLYIPYVKEKLFLNDAEIGFALFTFSVGALISIPFSSKIINSIGTGKITGIGILLFALCYVFPILSESYYQLSSSLFTIGLLSSITNIAMNSLIAEIEQLDRVNFMSTAHGFFSLGGVIGAGLGSIFITFIKIPLIHFTIIILLVSLINLFFIKKYYTIRSNISQRKTKISFAQLKPLLMLALIGVIISGNEGSIEYWSPLFLKDEVLVTTESFLGLGFLFFSFFMMLGRFFGDKISLTVGSVKTILYGFLIAIVGHLLVLTGQFIIVITGFSLLGMGLSVIYPEIIRLTSKSAVQNKTLAISFVSGIGFLGFLSAPVLIGYISKVSNLTYSFAILTLSCCIAVALISKLKKTF